MFVDQTDHTHAGTLTREDLLDLVTLLDAACKIATITGRENPEALARYDLMRQRAFNTIDSLRVFGAKDVDDAIEISRTTLI